ncbi:MAG: acyl-CoA thioesterase [Cyclobacteriaceae bacterium]
MFHIDPNKQYPKETSSKVIIRFQDCDPLQHLNNAKYFDYFFNARDDQVAKLYGVRMSDIFQAYQCSWVAYSHQIAYIRPAGMGEIVTINSRIIWYNENTVVVEYFMMDENQSHLKTVLWTTIRYIEVKTGKSTNHSGEVLAFLEAVKVPDFDFDNSPFNLRIKQIKEEVKLKTPMP